MDINDEEKLRQKFEELITELQLWPEDKVQEMLARKLRDEGWRVSTAPGQSHGVDVDARKGEQAVIIEVKGEPNSPKTYRNQRRGYLRGALASIIKRMVDENPNQVFCIAFPNNDYYPTAVPKQIPVLVRKKLNLFALFVQTDGSILVLRPKDTNSVKLTTFDSLFMIEC